METALLCALQLLAGRAGREAQPMSDFLGMVLMLLVLELLSHLLPPLPHTATLLLTNVASLSEARGDQVCQTRLGPLVRTLLGAGEVQPN